MKKQENKPLKKFHKDFLSYIAIENIYEKS